MYNHNKAQQSKDRVHISWDILYVQITVSFHRFAYMDIFPVSIDLFIKTIYKPEQLYLDVFVLIW